MEATGHGTTTSVVVREFYIFNSKYGNDTDNVSKTILFVDIE